MSIGLPDILSVDIMHEVLKKVLVVLDRPLARSVTTLWRARHVLLPDLMAVGQLQPLNRVCDVGDGGNDCNRQTCVSSPIKCDNTTQCLAKPFESLLVVYEYEPIQNQTRKEPIQL